VYFILYWLNTVCHFGYFNFPLRLTPTFSKNLFLFSFQKIELGFYVFYIPQNALYISFLFISLLNHPSKIVACSLKVGLVYQRLWHNKHKVGVATVMPSTIQELCEEVFSAVFVRILYLEDNFPTSTHNWDIHRLPSPHWEDTVQWPVCTYTFALHEFKIVLKANTPAVQSKSPRSSASQEDGFGEARRHKRHTRDETAPTSKKAVPTTVCAAVDAPFKKVAIRDFFAPLRAWDMDTPSPNTEASPREAKQLNRLQ
jgi:hypothetical protein